MDIKQILITSFHLLFSWRKAKLANAIIALREKYLQQQDRILQLEKENGQLKQKIETEQIKKTNQETNKPSSKKAEWEKDPPDDKGKKKRKKRNPRKGAGNRPKNLIPVKTVKVSVDTCDLCGKDLSEQPALESINERIVEDIADPPEETIVTQIIQEKGYCSDCKMVITAKSDLALPGSDIGLNATVLVCYLWIASCVSYPKIKEYLGTFFRLDISTSGLSRHLIRVSVILKDVYDEILNDIKNGKILQADETGWRVRGKHWWLWVFGTHDTAYFTVDKTRGSDVVRRVLGEIFFGVLVVDGWSAYLSLLCEQQSCMAHLLRKIRKFRDAFPHLGDIVKFYLKLRRIIRDGERLQEGREQLGEFVFKRRLKHLKKRLKELLEWPEPSHILQEIIEKVRRQEPRILTFVEHPGVPFHNNYAEYLIRIGVLKRKISGGSVSAEGAEAYAILLSIYTTCKLRGISFPKYLKETLKYYCKTGKLLSLKAYADSSVSVTESKKAA